jgi:hypothetical protein
MDSNFQVIINANVQGLRTAIKEAQSTLAQFDKSVGGAANSTKALEREANRGRLAAFAFGQVIRDAGFFSQSFGLGLLAISNNIPILIDQLVLLSGVSAGVGSALSLLGSILTAALTIWAYSSSAVDKNKQSIDEWRDSLEDTTEVQLKGKQAALDEVTSLDMLYKAATDVSNSMDTRLKAGKALQEQYPTTFANLSAEQIALGKNEAAYNGLRDSIYGAAIAEAGKDKIVANASRILDNSTKIIEARSASIKAQTELLAEQAKTAGVDPNKVRVSTGATPGSAAINAEAEKSFARQSVLKKEIAGYDAIIYGATSDTNSLNERNANIWGIIQKYTKNVVDNLDDGKGSTEETVSLADKLNQIFAKTRDNFKGGGLLLADDQAQQDALDFIDIVDELIYKGKTLAEVTDLITESVKGTFVDTAKIREAVEAYYELKKARDGYFDVVEIQGLQNKLMEALVPSDMEVIASQWQMLAQGISTILGNTFEDLGSLIAGSIGGEEFWGGILKSVGGFLSAFGKQLIAFGVGMKIYAIALKALQSGNPAKIAAGAGGLIFAGALLATAGGIISGLAGGKRTDNNNNNNGGGGYTSGVFGGARPFAAGGIVSGPTNALIGEYPGARNNPEVVAPLDKLSSIIAGSIGGGDMGGQLTARISGNDLVILLDRASKNRKNYF